MQNQRNKACYKVRQINESASSCLDTGDRSEIANHASLGEYVELFATCRHQTSRIAIRRRHATSKVEQNRHFSDFCEQFGAIAIAHRHVVSDIAKRRCKRLRSQRKMRLEM